MADVSFTFSGDAASLQNALNEIKGEVRKTKDSVQGLAGQFTASFAAIGGAIAAVKGAFAFFSNIPAQAARIEDLRVTFTQMTGDAEQAGQILDDLWHDAANGAVGLEQMAATAKPLLNVFSDSASIREWSRRFADIATGSGVAADQLSKVFSRAMAIGKIDSRAIDTLARQGIPIYQELAAVIGTTTEAVQAMVKKGLVSADQYAAAFRRMTDEGGKYYNLSSQLSNTSAGSWGTMLENINRVAAKLGEPINEAFTPVLQSIAVALEESPPKTAPVIRLIRMKEITAAKAPPERSFAQEPPMAAANRICRLVMMAQPMFSIVDPTVIIRPMSAICSSLPRLSIIPAAGITAITVIRTLPSFWRKSKLMPFFFAGSSVTASAAATCSSPSVRILVLPAFTSPVTVFRTASSAPSQIRTGVVAETP